LSLRREYFRARKLTCNCEEISKRKWERVFAVTHIQ